MNQSTLTEEFSIVALDIETTGLDISRDEIIEIAAVRFVKGEETERLSLFVRPEQKVPEFIKRLTHISDEQLAGGIAPTEALRQLRDFVGSDFLVCHNASFDLPFIAQQLIKHGNFPLTNHYFDTLELSRIYLPHLLNHKLESLAEFFSITNEGAHRAIYDTLTTGKAFYAILEFIDKHIPVRINTQLLQAARLASMPSSISIFLERVVSSQSRFALLDNKKQPIVVDQPNYIIHELPPKKNISIDEVFGQDGYFGKGLSSYEFRNGQVQMAEAVNDAFQQNQYLLVEAGTGVGKSFAYLFPSVQFSLQTGHKVVISTNTKNLQEQLFYKDLPTFKENIPLPFKALLLKGRENYLCEKRWQDLIFDIDKNLSQYEAEWLLYLIVWKQYTCTGDITDNHSFDRNHYYSLWKKIFADRYFCTGRKCAQYNSCHLMELRRLQEDANLLIVNHSLLLADVTADNATLGEFDHLILDEAHNLPHIASRHLGLSINQADFHSFLQQLVHTSKNMPSGILPRLATSASESMIPDSVKKTISSFCDSLQLLVQDQKDIISILFQHASTEITKNGTMGKLRIKQVSDAPTLFDDWQQVALFLDKIEEGLRNLLIQLSNINSAIFKDHEQQQTQLEGTVKRLEELTSAVQQLKSPDWELNAYWLEESISSTREYTSVSFNYAPLEVNKLLNSLFYPKIKSIVFTSATLALRGSFKYFRSQLGIDFIKDRTIMERTVDSPFNYAEQSMLLVADFLPEPSDPYFAPQSVGIIQSAIDSANTGTLVLFTSYKDMNYVYDKLSDTYFQQDIPFLAQGKGASRTAILQEFKEHGKSILLGTSSFWEGVDVQGESLSLLILYKLPFQVPSEPVVEAYIEKLEKEGKDSFMNYILPNALLKLRQGFGRLIRSKSDRGVVLILDSRVTKKRYGHYFKEVLPAKCANAQTEVSLEMLIGRFFHKI